MCYDAPMDAVTFSWAVLSAVTAGFQIFISKVFAERGGSGEVYTFLMYGTSCVLTMITWAFFGAFPTEGFLYVFVFAFLSGVTHGIGSIIRVDSLRYIDSTIYFPLNKVLGPLFVLCIGIFVLHEALTTPELIGVFLSFLVPLLLISRVEKTRQKNLSRGLVLLVVSTLLTSGSMFFVKLAVNGGGAVLFVSMASSLAGVTMSVISFLLKHKHVNMYTAHSSDWLIGIAAGFFGYVSFASIVKAYETGFLSLVYTINAHYILIPVFLSVWWYKEHMDMRKFAAVILSCITLTLLY